MLTVLNKLNNFIASKSISLETSKFNIFHTHLPLFFEPTTTNSSLPIKTSVMSTEMTY